MGSIQNSINQLITTTAIGAYASRQSIRADREREMARTDQVHRETPAIRKEREVEGIGTVLDYEKRPYTPEELEEHRFKEYKGGKGIIGDLKDIKTEKQLQRESVDVVGPSDDDLREAYEQEQQKQEQEKLKREQAIKRAEARIKNRAEQARKAEEFRKTVKSQQFADLVNNANATAADAEKWRKQ